MGFVKNDCFHQGDANDLPSGWESLGRLVQTQTLDAVAQLFFDVGLAELCVNALVNTRCGLLQGTENE